MKVFFLYDEDEPDRRAAGSALAAWAEKKGHELESACASGPMLKPCLGCFGCWLKTPGRCVIPGDRGAALAEAFVRPDLVVLGGATPYGCFALPIKAAIERSLPIQLPFFWRFRGQVHHVPRYERLPRIVSAGFGEASEAEDAIHLELVRAMCDCRAVPRQKRSFRFRGDGEALASWLEEAAAS